jgi:hypothetical protein
LLGLEGIVSKRRDSTYKAGPSKHWIKGQKPEVARDDTSRGQQLVERPQKITLGEMRQMGVRGLLVYCSDYHCSH